MSQPKTKWRSNMHASIDGKPAASYTLGEFDTPMEAAVANARAAMAGYGREDTVIHGFTMSPIEPEVDLDA